MPTLLPSRPAPQRDEALSSWLARVVRANALGSHSLFTLALGGRHNVLSQDIDCHLPRRALDGLAALLARERREIEARTLFRYIVKFVPFDATSRTRRWVLSFAERNRVPTNYWMQYCVECLRADAIPYFRREWRLALITACPVHRIRLRDRCSCGAPIEYLSPQADAMRSVRIPKLSVCPRCLADLRDVDSPNVEVDRRTSRFEKSLLRSVDRGYAPERGGPIYVQQLLQVLFILFGQLRRSPGLQRLVSACLGVNDRSKFLCNGGGAVPFERWSVERRHIAMRWAAMMLERWPSHFVRLCRQNKVWSYALWGDYDFVPFWFYSRIEQELHRPWYVVTQKETEGASRAIRNAGEPDTHHNRRRWLGRWFEKRPYMLKLVDSPPPLQLDIFQQHFALQCAVRRQVGRCLGEAINQLFARFTAAARSKSVRSFILFD